MSDPEAVKELVALQNQVKALKRSAALDLLGPEAAYLERQAEINAGLGALSTRLGIAAPDLPDPTFPNPATWNDQQRLLAEMVSAIIDVRTELGHAAVKLYGQIASPANKANTIDLKAIQRVLNGLVISLTPLTTSPNKPRKGHNA